MNINATSARTGAKSRALVVYESMFGNTESVARAIGEGLAEHVETTVLAAASAPSLPPALDLLVVGGPTHALTMSRPKTRQDAGARGARGADAAGIGVREWLAGRGPLPRDLAVATFDTKIRRPRLPGSAARALRRRLRRAGARSVVGTANFYVTGISGPMADGELERARRWGGQLATSAGLSAADREPAERAGRP